MAVGRAHVEHGRAPLGALDFERDHLARLGHGRIHREAIGDRAVELLGEENGGAVDDRELHGDHRRNALLDQALGRAGERVVARGATALACVENHHAQRTAVVAQQTAQAFAADTAPRAIVFLHNQHAVLRMRVEVAVTDEVEHVVRAAAQPPVQRREGRLLHALQHEQTAHLQIAHRVAQLVPLALDIQRRVFFGAGDHHQHAQRRCDAERQNALGQLQVAHQRRLDRKRIEQIEVPVVEVFPGQILKLGGIGQAQAQAQPFAGHAGLGQTAAETALDLTGKDGI